MSSRWSRLYFVFVCAIDLIFFPAVEALCFVSLCDVPHPFIVTAERCVWHYCVADALRCKNVHATNMALDGATLTPTHVTLTNIATLKKPAQRFATGFEPFDLVSSVTLLSRLNIKKGLTVANPFRTK